MGGGEGEGEGGREGEREEGRKEEVKSVFYRGGLVGWALTLVVVLGLFARQPLLLPGAVM